MTHLTAADYLPAERQQATQVIIDAPGEYITRTGLRVTIHEIKPPTTGTFNCKGTLWIPARREGGKPKPAYNVWTQGGHFRTVSESMFDVVMKAE